MLQLHTNAKKCGIVYSFTLLDLLALLLLFFFLHHVVSSFLLLATETAQQLKKTAGVPFHAKGRGLVKKIDTTSELKATSKCFLFFTVKLLSSVKMKS